MRIEAKRRVGFGERLCELGRIVVVRRDDQPRGGGVAMNPRVRRACSKSGQHRLRLARPAGDEMRQGGGVLRFNRPVVRRL